MPRPPVPILGNTARRRAVTACACALALVLLAACDGDSGASGPPNTVREETTTTTTAPADPYAVPEVIDAAYVDRVLAELYRLEGDAARIILREGDIKPEAADLLGAVYAIEPLNQRLELWGKEVRRAFEGIRNPPGDLIVNVEELRTARPSCIFAVVRADFRPRSSLAGDPNSSFRALMAKDPGQDPKNLNHTPWVIALDVVSIDGKPPGDPCSGA